MAVKPNKSVKVRKAPARRRAPKVEPPPAPPKSLGPCVVCGEEIAPFSTERLCFSEVVR